MHIRGMTKTNRAVVTQVVVVSLVIAALAGCASMFKVQVLYEVPQPGTTDSRYVMRLEKEQNPITGTKEEFPARPYDISEPKVREMMAAMYRRFFKDPATFVPPDRTFGEAIVDGLVDAALDGLLGETPPPDTTSGDYRPKLREDAHPASMSTRTPVFTPEEIEALAPEIVRAFAELRKGEHLTLQTRAFDSQGRGGLAWNESEDVTSVAIRFSPAGKFLGIAHGATISWDFYTVHGLQFRGKGDQVYTYSTRDEHGFSEEFDFLAIFPREEDDTDYWRVVFPVE